MLSKRFGRCFCEGLTCLRRVLDNDPSLPFKTLSGRIWSIRSLHASGSTLKQNEKVEDYEVKKILLLKKITRYEYEKQMRTDSSEEDLRHYVTSKGSDYKGLRDRHDEYFASLDRITEAISKRGLEVEVVNRFGYTEEKIDWADVILTAGGDGTFLMAASKVKGHSKPVIGINTDPVRSEGYLCLPRPYSPDDRFDEGLDRLINGQYKWRYRQRIRLTMSGLDSSYEPINLHDQELLYPEYRFIEHVKENEQYNSHKDEGENEPHVLPYLALNEVYLGESLSARVSFYEISMNNSPCNKQKSSGITVCTGTGSTSWYFNINHVPYQSIESILKITEELSKAGIDVHDQQLIQDIMQRFNNSLVFDPAELKMAYTVRDPVPHGIFQVTNPRGFCNKMEIRSRMWDAWVVIDGGITYRFNDGARVYLDMFEEDALRCVHLD